MIGHQPFDIEIDKLTRSIENAVTGDSFKTEVVELTLTDIRKLKRTDWLFDWKAEAKNVDRKVYKLVIIDNPNIVQGLIGLQDRGDHVFMSLIESAIFNRGNKKVYLGVPGNLVAFACKVSVEKGYQGFVAFDAKTALIKHYKETLYAYYLILFHISRSDRALQYHLILFHINNITEA